MSRTEIILILYVVGRMLLDYWAKLHGKRAAKAEKEADHADKIEHIINSWMETRRDFGEPRETAQKVIDHEAEIKAHDRSIHYLAGVMGVSIGQAKDETEERRSTAPETPRASDRITTPRGRTRVLP